MSIEYRYFDQDKNYLLKTVQAFSKDRLLKKWTEHAYQAYLIQQNPLGLEDNFTIELRGKIDQGSVILSEAYDLLSAIYRLKHGDNQLTFMWDGRSHMQYYDEQWEQHFDAWVAQLCLEKDMYRSIVKAALDQYAPTQFWSKVLSVHS